MTEGRSSITVLMRIEIADGLAKKAIADRRTQSACLDLLVETYLTTRTLQPMPEGARIHRQMAGQGETKIRRYRVEPKTVRLLQEAEDMGYSQSWVIEQAVKEGLEQ